jgi:hypothetical protein
MNNLLRCLTLAGCVALLSGPAAAQVAPLIANINATSAGQVLIQNGLFALTQLQQLKAVAPVVMADGSVPASVWSSSYVVFLEDQAS